MPKDTKTIYCIAPCSKGPHGDKPGETFKPGDTFTGKIADCGPLLSSGRFSDDEDKAKAIIERQKKATTKAK